MFARKLTLRTAITAATPIALVVGALVGAAGGVVFAWASIRRVWRVELPAGRPADLDDFEEALRG